MRIALTGMRAAETQVAARARNIVNINTPGYRPVEPVMQATENGVRAAVRERPLAPQLTSLQDEAARPDMSLGEEIVQMKLAQNAYEASARVTALAARMDREAMEILS